MNRSIYTVSAYVVASTGTYVGVGMHTSPRVAIALAQEAAYEALYVGDAAVGYVSGIAVEGWTMRQYGRVVGSHCDL